MGFTKTEALIVGGIIAILLLAGGVGLTAARERVRDYKRLSDVARVQVALELYFNEQNQYPVSDGRIALGAGRALRLSSPGIQSSGPPAALVFLNPVPSQTSIAIKGSELDVYAYQSDGET